MSQPETALEIENKVREKLGLPMADIEITKKEEPEPDKVEAK